MTASVTTDERRAYLLASIKGGGRGSPLAEAIFEELAVDIVEGRLPSGADLNSVELARRFGTSRTSVREALVRLQAEGLVIVPARRRPYVAHVELSEVLALYEIRASLYALTSSLIVRNVADSEIAMLWRWQHLLEADIDAGDADAFHWHNVAFRNEESRMCGNPELARLIGSLGIRTLRFRRLSLDPPGRLKSSAADHRRLIDAYEQRDEEVACAITRALVFAGYRAISQQTTQAPGAEGEVQLVRGVRPAAAPEGPL
jgi:DNA-binding GntR family transcriptional regulator